MEHIDAALSGRAERHTDFAASMLTGWPVMPALIGAAKRGVKVRIYMAASDSAGNS